MKKIAFLVSAVYFIYFLGILSLSILCNAPFCRIQEDEPLGIILVTLLPLLLVFLLSLITYKMREEMFRAWWNIARWFVPIIIVITYLINSSHQQSGFGGVAQGAFEFLILFLLYVIFIIVSFARIILAYRRSKRGI
ncbi:MAG: hypothetical protein AAB547_00635 [Patescibacteria group bacterium]